MPGPAENVLTCLLIIVILSLLLLLTGSSSAAAEESSFSPSGESQARLRLALSSFPPLVPGGGGRSGASERGFFLLQQPSRGALRPCWWC